jgi:hypothetical protein
MEWVEDFVKGVVKLPVRVISNTNLAGSYTAGVSPDPVTQGTFTLGATGALVIDGVTLAVGDRLLLAGQTDGTQNGIYTVTVAGDGTTAAVIKRADDWSISDQLFPGVRIDVQEGTLYADTTWALVTTGTLTIDATAMVFTQVARSSGAAKYAETITGDGVETEFAVEHDLGTTDVVVQVFNLVTNAEVGVDIVIEDANSVSIGFDSAPTSAMSFRVVVIG